MAGKGGDATFTHSEEFGIWGGLNAVTVAIWVATCFGLLPGVQGLGGRFHGDPPAIPVPGRLVICVVGAALPYAAFMAWSGLGIPLDRDCLRIGPTWPSAPGRRTPS